ncbi:hypothetical protein B0H10DRAFT_1957101 [Mycena sp. CBHHK59/15]|nr:hypothetical protein B0H10DRAFT_1957101 [Mycena sp. CBHHK59/15]
MAKKRLTDHANRPGHLRAREAKQRSLAEKELARQMTASRLGSSGSTAASDPTEDRTTSLGNQSHCPAVFDFEAEEELDEEDAVIGRRDAPEQRCREVARTSGGSIPSARRADRCSPGATVAVGRIDRMITWPNRVREINRVAWVFGVEVIGGGVELDGEEEGRKGSE